MKKIFAMIVFSVITGVNSYASQTLTCWDKYDPSNHKPSVKVNLVSDSVISNITFPIFGEQYNIAGPIEGKINPRARKYAGWHQFGWNWKNGEGYSVLSLPPNVTQEPSYFYASIQSVTTEGGGVQHLNCIVNIKTTTGY